jgi:hypothetical protein
MQSGDPKALEFFNRAAYVTAADGTRCALSEQDFEELNRSNYWQHRSDPSTWLVAATVLRARHLFSRKLTRAQVIELCAQTLHMTVQEIESALHWNANYMAWHDGGSAEENHVWPLGNDT